MADKKKTQTTGTGNGTAQKPIPPIGGGGSNGILPLKGKKGK